MSSLILPVASPILLPPGAGTIIVPGSGLVIPREGLVLTAATMRAQAALQHHELTAQHGTAVADAMMGPRLALIERIAAEERHQHALDLFGHRKTAQADVAKSTAVSFST